MNIEDLMHFLNYHHNILAIVALILTLLKIDINEMMSITLKELIVVKFGQIALCF